MRTIVSVCLLSTIACTALFAQEKLDKGKLETELKKHYKLTKFVIMTTDIREAGDVFTMVKDGIQANGMSESTPETNYIKAGRAGSAGSDGGAGLIASEILHGKRSTLMLQRGDRVYITKIDAFDRGIAFDVMTVSSTAGTRRGTPMQARLIFQNEKGRFPDVTTAEEVQRLVKEYLVSEAEASAPKKIALGQTKAEVESAFGKPKAIIDLGAKTIYTYDDIKVTFTDGKVSDVQ